MLTMILCVDNNNGIAKNSKIPWHYPNELKHFKKSTINKIVVMGFKTYMSIGQPLKKRTNIVLSKQNKIIDGVKIENNYKNILKLAKHNDVIIIGGKQIYELFNSYADKIILTKLNKNFNCDLSYFPNLNFFQLINTKIFPDYSIYTYKSIKNKIIDGKLVQNHIINKIQKNIEYIKNNFKISPAISIIQVGNNDSSNIYIKNKIKFAEKFNINVNHIKLNENISQDELLNIINKLNNDKDTNGILVQLPLPKHISENIVANSITPLKDVDCFNSDSLGKILRGEKTPILPCTPSGIIELFKFYKIKIAKKNIVIVGRSNIVSKPLAMLLLQKNATITICHSYTKKLNEKLINADIIITAAGCPNLINHKNIKNDVIIIDVSINRDNNKIIGDVNWNNKLLNKVKLITPVPGGVGPMTITMLLYNLLELTKLQI